MLVRPYEDRDREDVRFVSLNNGGPCTLPKRGRIFMLATYCDYFIEREGRNCFVTADDAGRAVGYVICAENYDRFYPCFMEEYLPRISRWDITHRRISKNAVNLQGKYREAYPAHFHINLLPEYQRMGFGGRMLDALRAHLKAKGIPGVMLCVAETNNTGISFYRKYGFTFLEQAQGEIAFGMKL